MHKSDSCELTEKANVGVLENLKNQQQIPFIIPPSNIKDTCKSNAFFFRYKETTGNDSH